MYFTVFSFIATGSKEVRCRKKLNIITYIDLVFIGVVWILEMTGVLKLSNITGLMKYTFPYTIVVYAIFRIREIFPLFIKGEHLETALKYSRFIIRTLSVLVAAELFIFNFNSYHLIFGNYPVKELDLSTVTAWSKTKVTPDGLKLRCPKGALEEDIYEDKALFEIEGVDVPVGTIQFDLKQFNQTVETRIEVDFSDDSHSATFRTECGDVYVDRFDEKSSIMICNYSGNVHKLRFWVTMEEGERLTLSALRVNVPVPLVFSLKRVLFLFAVCMFIFYFKNSKVLAKEYDDTRSYCRTAAMIITAVMIWICTSAISNTALSADLIESFKCEEGNQLTQELVDAFEHGQFSLLEKPGDDLMALENPYDYSQRGDEGIDIVDYKWDHLLYNGKYYSYYGVAPVILFFLPYHLITGYYFPTNYAVLIFSVIGLCALGALYMTFISKWFKKLPAGAVLAGLLIIEYCSGIFTCNLRPQFYEASVACGFMFTTLGAYMMLKSNVIGDGKISIVRLLCSATFLALAVLSRPTLALYSVAAMFFIAGGVVKMYRSRKNGEDTYKSKSYPVKYFAAALIPFVICGSFQMFYNYSRFGSILDFGIQYSLTINDFTRSQYHTHFVMVGIYNYLFNCPALVPYFPFVKSEFQLLDINGYYFVDFLHIESVAIGLIYKALPLFAYAFLPVKAFRKSANKDKKYNMLLLIITCIAAPLVILISIWESGYAIRYLPDFAWQMIIGSLVLVFLMYNVKRNDEQVLTQKQEYQNIIIMRFMLVSVLVCVLLCSAQYYQYFDIAYKSPNLQIRANIIKRLFEFWR
ncbi:MAG: hypothetical protein Q4F95_10230 [Oscillospiraceae bacterium]|nr:hypothetical protein [Oscillospiraceae bacterium]